MKCPFRTITKYTKDVLRFSDYSSNDSPHYVQASCPEKDATVKSEMFAECYGEECPSYDTGKCNRLGGGKVE